MANKWGNNGNNDRLFSWAPESLQTVTAVMSWKDTCSLEENSWQTRQYIEKQRHYFADKGPSSQSYGFCSSHVWMWELDHKEGWMLKNLCFELWCWRRLLSSLDCKEIKPVHPKRNQLWIFTGRTDTEAETPILWPLDAKCRLIVKDPDAGKAWRQEKGTTEDKMVGCHHRLHKHEFEQTPGDGEGQGSRCAAVHGSQELDTTERLNNLQHCSQERCLKYFQFAKVLFMAQNVVSPEICSICTCKKSEIYCFWMKCPVGIS